VPFDHAEDARCVARSPSSDGTTRNCSLPVTGEEPPHDLWLGRKLAPQGNY
jgi:hypothetical protein